MKRLINAMRKAGYTWFRITLNGCNGWILEVREDIRRSNWPALWDVCEQLGIGRGGGGTLWKQVRDFRGIKGQAVNL